MSSLGGARVALLEGRMPSELADLVRRHGGEPYSVPAVRELPLESPAEVAAFVDDLAGGALPVVVCLTGAGVKALFEEAERLGRLPELLSALKKVTVVCRGPKPAAVLRRHAVPIALNTPEPYTTRELLEMLAGLDLAGTRVGLLHYGERNAQLAAALHGRGAHVVELVLYEWLLPEDSRPLQNLVPELLGGRVDAIAFTAQVQVRHLFQVAAELGKAEELARALNTEVAVASVGPVCTAALEERGVTPAVVPEHPKMGPMVGALARWMEQRRRDLPVS
jgi:uroporphyrinogen-III synthase